jgi:hypothetical protein
MPKQDPKNIGFDPIKWVQRLQDVNADSQFTDTQKEIIEKNLQRLIKELEK